LRGTPVILPTKTPCYLCTDMVCISACPHGALETIPREQVRMGRAMVEPALCEPMAKEGCESCVSICPLPGVMRQETGKAPSVAPWCVGCGLCVWTCPGEPRAMTVVPSFAPSTR
jgi:Fe-S-cluster-containing dehydrogenase component